MLNREGLASGTSDAPGRGTLRESLSLDGEWLFRMLEVGRASQRAQEWRRVTVPAPWQAQGDDLRDAFGTGVYRRPVEVPGDWAEGELWACFGAVGYCAEVLVDGRPVGSHEGGYLPFAVKLPEGLGPGARFDLEVRATLPDDDPARYPTMPFSEIPHGKQGWYGPLGGIWQSVRLERRHGVHLLRPRIEADLGRGEARVALPLSGPAPEGSRLAAVIRDGDGTPVASEAVALQPGADSASLRLKVEPARAWSPDAPHLYRAELRLDIGGAAVDALTESFGFRAIETRDGRFFLNGEPFYLRGALDQDYYPDTIATPPSLEFLEDQIRQAKALGLNCLRCHIKAPDPRYYEAADRLGMLIWSELPNVRHSTQASRRRLNDTLRGIVERDGNHPSIIAWTIINEDWGTDIDVDPSDRAWLAQTYAWLKALDPGRLVIDNSPCWPNFHLSSDIDDYHWYRTLPDRRQEWDAITAEFAARPDWTFSPHADAKRTGTEPLVVSEFGNWGLPPLSSLEDGKGREAWWAETGHERSDGATYPHGVERRFRAWRLDRVFGDYEAFAQATQWHQFRALKYEIESIRSHAAIAGYVITELTDVHWEANGLLDMRRRPRVFHRDFAAVNAETAIVPLPRRRAAWSGEPVVTDLRIAHGGSAPLRGCRLAWRLGARGEPAGVLTLPDIAPASVATLPPLEFLARQGEDGGLLRLHLELQRPDGSACAANSVDFAVLPRRTEPRPLRIWSPDEGLRERAAALGYADAPDLETANLVVTTRLGEAVIERLRRGGRALVLVEDAGALPPRPARSGNGAVSPGLRLLANELPAGGAPPGMPARLDPRFPGIGVSPRHGTVWAGNWMTSFSWLRRRGPFARLPGGPLLDDGFERVIPEHVLTGFTPLDFAARVHAGMTVGWVHKTVALCAERPFGSGNAVFATFRLTRDPPGADPVATTLFDALVESAAAGGCAGFAEAQAETAGARGTAEP